jgi:tetratricopeptide (TPR) repeat protein
MNIFKKPQRVASEPRMVPGLEKMMEYSKMERLSARLPPPADVLKACTDYFAYKSNHSTSNDRAIPDVQAQHLFRCLNYLDQRLGLSTLDRRLLRNWILVFWHRAHKDSTVHQDMVELLFRALTQNRSQNAKLLRHEHLRAYVGAMCATGGTAKARDEVVKYTGTHVDKVGDYSPIAVWELIIQGFLKEEDEQALLRTLDDLDKYAIQGSRQLFWESITRFYIIQGNVEKAIHWYNKARVQPTDVREFQQLQRVLLKLAMRNSDMKLGQLLVRDLTAGTPTKFQWEMILEWAAATGKGADEIDRMIGVMERANQSLPKEAWRTPDTVTINKLVRVAVDRKDPYLAERLLAVGKARNIPPDALTLIYQMQYRLAVKDVDGALTVYKHLQSHDLSKNQDISVVNELIQNMCASGRQDFDSIMNVAADLSDRQARFDPATVSALSVLHLSRDEVHDVIDLLNTHVYNYDIAGRASVQSTLIDYCLKPTTTTAQAWDTYIIVKQVFDDTAREQRVKIMNEFFRRQRPDMAVHVFNHMRAHTRQDTIPTVDTYVACLSGIGKAKDEESLEVVYNQLKLDFNIEPNTLLYNALMKAYTSCESPRTALGFWDDIATSREGPNMSSIHLAMRACEDAPWGDEKARKIWLKLNRTGIELDQDLWASYAAALVGNGNIDSAINSLEEAHVEQGLDMDTLV